MTRKSFYNTINLVKNELLRADQSALNQEQKVLRFFIQQGRDYAGAPSAVRKRVFSDSIPLTSVRRAMTNLANRNDLEKTEIKTQGQYGKPEHVWRVSGKWVNDRPTQGKLL